MLYFDVETHNTAGVDLKEVSAWLYQTDPNTHTTLVQYAFDEGPVEVWQPGDPVPQEIMDFAAGNDLVCAHNARFDRLHWQYVLVADYGWPDIESERFIDSMAIAETNTLPGNLGSLGALLRLKHEKMKAVASNGLNIQTAYLDRMPPPEDMPLMIEYGIQDVLTMRDALPKMRPLALEEWREYWASERINDRGMPVDIAQARLCYRAHEKLKRVCGEEFTKLTGLGPDYTMKISEWFEREGAGTEALLNMTSAKGKVKIDRTHRDAMLEADDATPRMLQAVELLNEVKGASATKFRRIIERGSVDGRVHDAYAFSGAGRTGRYSSRGGLQLHNMPRDSCRGAHEIQEAHAGLLGWLDHGVGRKEVGQILKRLIRPTIRASKGKTLVWGDWSGIEARICPWLTGSTRGSAQRVLDDFASGGDPYVTDAMAIYQRAREDITKEQRYIGKVAHLALQFGGGAGALIGMARGYGVALTRQEAEQIVSDWRAANGWVRRFGDTLWDAAHTALDAPRMTVNAGRLRFVFQPQIMGGTLICWLPCGRPLMYAGAKFITEYDAARDWEKEVLKTSRGRIWFGTLLENATQGAAGSVLRNALFKLEYETPLYVVLHTHDEVAIETVNVDDGELLKEVMEDAPNWLDGLPTPVEIDHGERYSK